MEKEISQRQDSIIGRWNRSKSIFSHLKIFHSVDKVRKILRKYWTKETVYKGKKERILADRRIQF